ncbi:hypothetical protein H0H92_010148, partial [Tricholoma furcatifolium]
MPHLRSRGPLDAKPEPTTTGEPFALFKLAAPNEEEWIGRGRGRGRGSNQARARKLNKPRPIDTDEAFMSNRRWSAPQTTNDDASPNTQHQASPTPPPNTQREPAPTPPPNTQREPTPTPPPNAQHEPAPTPPPNTQHPPRDCPTPPSTQPRPNDRLSSPSGSDYEQTAAATEAQRAKVPKRWRVPSIEEQDEEDEEAFEEE